MIALWIYGEDDSDHTDPGIWMSGASDLIFSPIGPLNQGASPVKETTQDILQPVIFGIALLG